MTYQDLKRVNEAPKSGQLLAYTRKDYCAYGILLLFLAAIIAVRVLL